MIELNNEISFVAGGQVGSEGEPVPTPSQFKELGEAIATGAGEVYGAIKGFITGK